MERLLGTPLRVRPATVDDHPALARLQRDLDAIHARVQPGFFRASVDGPGESQRTLEWVRAALGDPHAALIVADEEGVVVGAIRLRLWDSPEDPTVTPARRVNVESLVVASTARRRGIGRALMAEADRWARARGATQVVLTVWEGNDTAERFYRALGFGDASHVLARDLGKR